MSTVTAQKPKTKPKPFLKWPGGKRQLLSQFDKFFPEDFDRYHEPMVGGGAVFFHLSPEQAVINDVNSTLMAVYQHVKNNPREIIRLLEEIEEKYHSMTKKEQEDFYYQKRDEFNDIARLTYQKTAYFIFLNRTCYNGMYRENSNGEFNVPFGKYKNPTICFEGTIEAASELLQNTEIVCEDFEKAVEDVRGNDFVYFDPPYVPLNSTSNFTEYTNGGFGKEGQERLAKTFEELDKRGAKVALSNSDTPLVKDLYSDFNINILKARRSINSNGNGRGKINEVLVTNF